MSNYTKATNFASKDTLPTGNAGKIVKGTELDDEFNAIAVAVATKSDLASPTFTGTPTAPTADSSSNSTQIATTAFVKSLGGRVVQMVQSSSTTQASTTSGSYVGTGHTASITPTSTSSKILVLMYAPLWQTNGFGGNAFLSLYRNGVNLLNDMIVLSAPGQNSYGSVSFNLLDSPATTSSVSYQPYIRADQGGNTFYNGTSAASITLLEIL
jgi:hypothetical protein